MEQSPDALGFRGFSVSTPIFDVLVSMFLSPHGVGL
jgi:hypothetical protein